MIRRGDHITQVGRMNHRIVLQSQTKTADGMGGSSIAWTDTATLWADIMPISAQERTQSDRLTLDITHRIIIRHRTVSATTQRFKFGTRIMNIASSYNPDESSSHLVILAREEA